MICGGVCLLGPSDAGRLRLFHAKEEKKAVDAFIPCFTFRVVSESGRRDLNSSTQAQWGEKKRKKERERFLSSRREEKMERDGATDRQTARARR